ncbi:TPA: hypothetical protein N0F65_011334 [Lagenidium giganteum]|uniref:Uncharacterized protein n=1 Tax=Lagenidium giganteum TaxID=4803 RepID=A0AAV2YL02_9STRA|nr:TPA: hypothetical protein N0F65_011334 [Lagenidium giganteum]
MTKAHDDDDGEGLRLIESFVETAAKVLAPNSLQFNEREFQQSPQEAQDAAREAAKLVRPGDLIFITTRGLLYSVGRSLTGNEYDHVMVVLDETHVMHVGPPKAKLLPIERVLLPHRQPVVLRVPMAEDELTKFLRCVRRLNGCRYDITRAYQLILRLALNHLVQAKPLAKLPFDTQNDSWICSDAIMVLLAGCSSRFKAALIKARDEVQLDIFTHGSASLSDFSRIRRISPDALARVRLPIMNFTLVPKQRSLREYVPEVLQFVTRWQAGQIQWPLLEELLLSKVKYAVAEYVPGNWPWKQKAQVIAYVAVLLLMLRRGATVTGVLIRSAQLVLLRQLVTELLKYWNTQHLQRLAKSKL